ncbi:MAG: hypothetical protein V7K48_16770 [Nostoc sp.]|uniref:hypothetical protein n=1 Tax=Nostoc sp. TaxID=1180 RepID=UPI002FF4873C
MAASSPARLRVAFDRLEAQTMPAFLWEVERADLPHRWEAEHKLAASQTNMPEGRDRFLDKYSPV